MVVTEEEAMMKEILRLIHETGVVNTSEIADAIGTTHSMVQQAITTLQSKGYLALIDFSQNCGQAHCASCGNCNSALQNSKCAYVITEKGKKYLSNG